MPFDNFCVLLVEDKENQHVIAPLLNARNYQCANPTPKGKNQVSLTIDHPTGLRSSLTIKVLDGVQDIIFKMATEAKASNLSCLGIIIDADDDMQQRWLQVRTKLTESLKCLEVPLELPKQGGFFQSPLGPRIGVWIMPDNRSQGMIEHYITTLIPKNDPVLPLVDKFLDSIPLEIRPFPP